MKSKEPRFSIRALIAFTAFIALCVALNCRRHVSVAGFGKDRTYTLKQGWPLSFVNEYLTPDVNRVPLKLQDRDPVAINRFAMAINVVFIVALSMLLTAASSSCWKKANLRQRAVALVVTIGWLVCNSLVRPTLDRGIFSGSLGQGFPFAFGYLEFEFSKTVVIRHGTVWLGWPFSVVATYHNWFVPILIVNALIGMVVGTLLIRSPWLANALRRTETSTAEADSISERVNG